MFGHYEVAVDDAHELAVTRLPDPDERQLPLPAEVEADALAALSAEEHALLARSAAGEIPCPWCGSALHGHPTAALAEPSVRLTCPDPQCGFEEV